MVAISLGDQIQKEKLPPEKEIQRFSSEKTPNQQLFEKCKNGRRIFLWTIFTEMATLGLFIRLIYSIYSFRFFREILCLGFLILGGIVLTFVNISAFRAYHKTKNSRYAQLQYMVLMLLLGLNIPIMTILWTVAFNDFMTEKPIPEVMFGLPLLVPLQFYSIVVWREIKTKMSLNEDHQAIKFFDQSKKWAKELYEEIWTIESKPEAEASISHQLFEIQSQRRAKISGIILFMLTFGVELVTLEAFMQAFSYGDNRWITTGRWGHNLYNCRSTYLKWIFSVFGTILIVAMNIPAMSAYFRTKKSRHATLKYRFLKAVTLFSIFYNLSSANFASYDFSALFHLILLLLAPIQLYFMIIWWKIGEKMSLGEDYGYEEISIFDCRVFLLPKIQQPNDRRSS